ncbi:hypothetical protein B0H13DRAFT_2426238 [Mycena leptocephala]|nr:hypothetical protein B0H13DRAFT_2426238 [Mycena leptocephala]
MRPTSSASSTSPLPRHVTSRLVFACEPTLRERRVSELQLADHSISPLVEQHRSAPIEPELARNPSPKPRSRRCFVCGTTGMHPLDFRVCPRTAVLLRRSLAKINNDGRLVSIDGSPLPMTRHPGGVAAHIISRVRSSRLLVTEPSESSSAPRPAHIPPHPVSSELCDHVPSPSREFNSRSPHAIPPIDSTEPEPEHVPLRSNTPRHPSQPFDRTRAVILLVLLESMLNAVFRTQLRAILSIIEGLNAQDPSTFRERMQPVLTRISHFIPVT